MESRSIGVQRGRCVGQAARRKPRQQGAVQLLGQVVAALVGQIHAAFHCSDLSVGGAGRAGFVFNVPQIEIGAMLARNQIEPRLVAIGLRGMCCANTCIDTRIQVPRPRFPILQADDNLCRKHPQASSGDRRPLHRCNFYGRTILNQGSTPGPCLRSPVQCGGWLAHHMGQNYARVG
jgi:hypothetical protein